MAEKMQSKQKDTAKKVCIMLMAVVVNCKRICYNRTRKKQEGHLDIQDGVQLEATDMVVEGPWNVRCA
jgi:hypothetical protein